MIVTTMPTTSVVECADLKYQDELYPRSCIDKTTVARFRADLKAGANFPPIQVWKSRMLICDGVHRWSATTAEYGPNAKIKAELKEYKGPLDFLIEAIRLNRQHGINLTRYDYAICITRLKTIGASEQLIRKSLALTDKNYERLVRHKIAYHGGHMVAVKRTLEHYAGKTLSANVLEANDRAGGMKFMYYINQVINVLEHDAANWDDEAITERLAILCDLINLKLAAHK